MKQSNELTFFDAVKMARDPKLQDTSLQHRAKQYVSQVLWVPVTSVFFIIVLSYVYDIFTNGLLFLALAIIFGIGLSTQFIGEKKTWFKEEYENKYFN